MIREPTEDEIKSVFSWGNDGLTTRLSQIDYEGTEAGDKETDRIFESSPSATPMPDPGPGEKSGQLSSTDTPGALALKKSKCFPPHWTSSRLIEHTVVDVVRASGTAGLSTMVNP